MKINLLGLNLLFYLLQITFYLVKNNTLEAFIEAKYTDASLSPTLQYFSDKYQIPGHQVVYDLGSKSARQLGAISILSAQDYLEGLDL